MEERNDRKVQRHLYFIRISNHESRPHMLGIIPGANLTSSFLGNPSLNPFKVDESQFLRNGGIGLREELVMVETPKEIVEKIENEFHEEYDDSEDRHHKDRGIVSAKILNHVAYNFVGVRSGLDAFPDVLRFLQSKRYIENLKRIFADSLKKLKVSGGEMQRLDSEKNYRFYLRNGVLDLSFLSDRKYPRVTLDVIGKVKDTIVDNPHYSAMRKSIENLLNGNPYKEAIRVGFSREGFGYDLDFRTVNPKDFRTTDKLPTNIIF